MSEDLFKCPECERLKAQNAELLEACRFAQDVFREYEQLHRAKGTLEGEAKAVINGNHGHRLLAAIRRAEEGK
jgi:hypothetical protein